MTIDDLRLKAFAAICSMHPQIGKYFSNRKSSIVNRE